MVLNKRCLLGFLFISAFTAADLFAFCGFYVGKAGAKLYNKASQVVLVRNGNRTVISMMSDYQGPLKKFAMVVPVPTILSKKQIHVGERKLFERIDAFTAPRLVEYFDPSPCTAFGSGSVGGRKGRSMPKKKAPSRSRSKSEKSMGVTVEAKYSIGEYDILILSAKESDGLERWLRQEKYHIPAGASRAFKPYIKQNMKFFVAKVNLKKQLKTGLNHLRPLQFAFETKKFMLPIRLGMINANGPQELLIYILTKKGRVETTNYRTMKLPTDKEIPVYVKNKFGEFYKDMFDEQVRREGMRTVYTEHFWDMGWCDPCASNPLTPKELRQLGVFWLKGQGTRPGKRLSRRRRSSPAQPVKVTRLHVRYTKNHFPEDLMFQETNDRKNFQARYVLNHPWTGKRNECSAAIPYYQALSKKQENRAQQLATLTGWKIDTVRKEMGMSKNKDRDNKGANKDKWWNDIW